MAAVFDIDALAAACAQLPGLAGLTRGDLVPLRRKGTSNDHVRLGTSGLVARIPRFSHSSFDAPTNLAHQTTAFERAAASGHTPELRASLPIGSGLPAGALIVNYIAGHAPRLPGDMAAIAEALAALHALPVPTADSAMPLSFDDHPVTATRAAIERNAACFAAAELDGEARQALDAELNWARNFDGDGLPELPPRFVAVDTHPGNFLIDDDGRAWFTDLERAQYGAVPVDLAHASLPTSTGWDPDVSGSLTRDDVIQFYSCYLEQSELAITTTLTAWLLPLRRLTWLRTMTFFARWQADWSRDPATGKRDPAMDRHIARHIEYCFSPDVITATRSDWLGPDILYLSR